MIREIEVQTDEYGDLFIELPPDIIESLSLSEGDTMIWSVTNDDEIILTKSDE